MNFLDKILFLLMSLALIMALVFLAFVLQDLNNLWAESQELWEMFDDYWIIIAKTRRSNKRSSDTNYI